MYLPGVTGKSWQRDESGYGEGETPSVINLLTVYSYYKLGENRIFTQPNKSALEVVKHKQLYFK